MKPKQLVKCLFSTCLIIFLSFAFFVGSVFCQTTPVNCLDSVQFESPSVLSPFSSIGTGDRFGNCLDLEEFLSAPAQGISTYCGCENGSGIFELTFLDVCNERAFGFDDPVLGSDRREVVCRMFRDLSVLLNPSSTITDGFVRIEIKESEGMGVNVMGTEQIAVSSPVFITGFNDGINSGLVMSAIQGNADPYIGMDVLGFSLDSYHGFMRFNFEDFEFYLNVSDPIGSPGGLHDLYSTALHEAFHLLGFFSLIDPSSTVSLLSNIGSPRVYSRYDTYLGTIGGINNTSLGIPEYLNYPVIGNPYSVEVATNPSFINNPQCSADVSFNGIANPSQELYRPYPWNDSGISHLNCDPSSGSGCATNNGFIMNSCGPAGYAQRHPHQREVYMLCDLGYSLSGTYGSESYLQTGGLIPYEQYQVCSPSFCNAVGINDILPITVEIGSYIDIPSSDFLSNDINTIGYLANSFELLSYSFYFGEVGDNGNGVTYVADGTFPGWAVIRYLPICQDGTPGSWAYIFLEVVSPITEFPECEQDGNCNLICHGDFETPPYYPFFDFAIGNSTGTPDIRPLASWLPVGENICFMNFDLNDLNERIYANPVNQNYLGFETRPGNLEGWQFPLSGPLQIGQEYQLTFFLFSGCPGELNFNFSKAIACPDAINVPPLSNLLFNNGAPVDCGNGTVYDLGQVIEVPFDDTDTDGDNTPEWVEYTTNFIADGQYEFLLMYQDVGIPYIFVDDVSLINISENDFTLQSSVVGSPCSGSEINIQYTICSDVQLENLELVSNIPPFLVNYGSSGDFVNGSALINILQPVGSQFCETVILNLLVANGLAPGTEIPVDITVFSSDACLSTPVSDLEVLLIVDSQNNPDFSFQIQACSAVVEFNSSGSPNDIHQWDFGSANIPSSNEPNPVVDFSEPGTYTVSHTITNECGSSTTTIEIIIDDWAPKAGFTYTVAPCSTLASFISLGSSIGDHLWQFSTGAMSTEPNPSYNYPTPNTYLVTHTLTNSCGVDIETMTITIEEWQPDADFDFNLTPCSAEVDFTSFGDPNDSHFWEFEPGATSPDPNPSYVFPSIGSFTVTHTVTNSCGVDVETITIDIEELQPNADFDFDITPCSAEVDFTSIGDPNDDHFWEFESGATSPDPNPSYVFSGPGSFTVTHTVTNSCGVDVETITIDIEEWQPDAEFDFDLTPCSAEVDFTSIGDPNENHFWEFEPGATSPDPNPSYVFSGPGSFTVTHTVTNSCGVDVETITIDIEEWQPNADFDFDLTPCSAEVSFTSLGNPSDDHLWEFEAGATNTDPNTTFNYELFIPGTFTVTHSVTNNCGTDSEVSSLNIEDWKAYPVFSYNIDCGVPAVVTFQSVGQSASNTHLWDFGDSQLSTDLNPVHPYDENGTYTVVHTVTDACGHQETASIDVVIDCSELEFKCPCTGTNELNINAGNGLSVSQTEIPNLLVTVNNTPNILPNTCLAIKGRLILDQGFDFSILGGEVRMQPGSEIVVQSGSEFGLFFILNNEGIHGCEKMWRGISVESGGRLNMAFNIIQDAQYAVNARNNATLSLRFNTFNRDYVGIYTPPSTTFQTISLPLPIGSNSFTCTPGLLQPYPGQSPYPGSTTFAGIEANNANLTIGSQAGTFDINTFSGIRNGIVGNGSVLSIFRTQMSNLVGTVQDNMNVPAAGSNGVGIHLTNCFAFADNNTINGADDRGIHALRSSILADRNIINTRNGIVVVDGSSTFLDFEKNNITFSKYGTRIHNTNTPLFLSIFDNDYFSNATALANKGGAIDIYSAIHGAAGPTKEIRENTLNLNSLAKGIYINGDGFFEINYNTIDFTNPNLQGLGIPNALAFSYSDYNSLYGNNITAANLTSNVAGISISASEHSSFCCNTVNNTWYGFSSYGYCDNTSLRHLTLGDHEWGLTCNYSILGDQVHARNLWDGSFSNWARFYFNFQNEYESSEFYVEDADPFDPDIDLNPPLWPMNPIPSGWFLDKEGSAPTCQADEQCLPIPLVEDGESTIRENYIRIAQGEFLNTTYGQTTDWESKRSLYRLLVKNPSLKEQDNALGQFFESSESSVFNDFYQVDEQINDLLRLDNETASQLENFKDNLFSLNEAIKQIDSQLAAATNPADSALLMQKRVAKVQEVGLVAGNMFALYENLSIEKANGIEAVISNNHALPETLVPEQNRKQVNDVFLNTVVKGIYELTDEQFHTIANIAGQCPFTGGDAVYLARSLYELKEEGDFDDEALCAEVEGRSVAAPGQPFKLTSPGVLIFPNPGKQQLNFAFPRDEGYMSIEFIDLAGHSCKKIALPVGVESFVADVSDLKGGMYFCQINRANDIPLVQKVVILP